MKRLTGFSGPLLGLLLTVGAATIGAQSPAKVTAAPPPPAGTITSHPGWPAPKVSDVDSVDHILAALYDVISGPAHQPRDWNRMRSLFLPEARLAPISVVPGSAHLTTAPATDVTFLTIDGYIARASPHFEADGFYEQGIHNEIQQFGALISVFSTYESRHTKDDPKPFARGINTIQILKDGDRYWIEQVYWFAERDGFPVPAQYLPTAAFGSPDPSRPAESFAGDWTGQLEYRDYQSNERVFLPTWLNAAVAPDGHSVSLKYTYDDGPTKVVREELKLTLDLAANSATTTSESDHATATYAVSGFDDFARKNRGKLILTGTGKDNDKPADVRITLTLYRNLLTWVKETRPAGSTEAFNFRDGYTLTRTNAPRL